MTDQEAELMLRQLAEHYHEPVMPVSRYCAALHTWRMCIERQAQEEPDNKYRQGRDYVTHLSHIEIDIRKSSLLYRLIYCGETLRSVPCPSDHACHWSGPVMMNGCPHGCDGTGWLPCGGGEQPQ